MLQNTTLRYGLYVAAGSTILALTGVFGTFESRYVIAGRLSLATIVLLLLLGGAGYVAASQVRDRGVRAAVLNGIGGALLVGAVLALLTLIEANVDMSFVFPNFTGSISGTVAFGADLAPGFVILESIMAMRRRWRLHCSRSRM